MESKVARSDENKNWSTKAEPSDILHCCRICMARNTVMRDIFDIEPENIIDKIHFCSGVQFTKQDDLPSQICDTCLQNLSTAHHFKSLCLHADVTFRQVTLNEKIKLEVTGDDDYDNFTYDDENYSDDVKVKHEILFEALTGNNVRKSSKFKTKQVESKPPAKFNKTVVKRTPRGANSEIKGKRSRICKFKFSRLKCIPCNIKFKTKEESQKHKKEVHNNSEHWVCEICGKSFVHQSSHYSHLKSHLPPQYACDQCDYMSSYKHDLIKHLRIHTGIKLYQCEICSTSFYTSSNLTVHIRRSHEHQTRYQCPTCDRKFYDRTKLNRHVDSHNEIKRYECEICHDSFTRRAYWKKHLHQKHGILIPRLRPGRRKANLPPGDFSTVSKILDFKDNIDEKNKDLTAVIV